MGVIAAAVALLTVACDGSSGAATPTDSPEALAPAVNSSAEAPRSAEPASSTAATATPTPRSASDATIRPTPQADPVSESGPPGPTATPELADRLFLNPTIPKLVDPTPAIRPLPETPNDEPPVFLTFGWETDFSKHSVPYSEIFSGGPPRDGIPPIDNPMFVDVADPPEYMSDDEPVISLEIEGAAKAYPLAILMSHEIVNDELGGIPVSVTYCPLCNTSIVFDRRVGGRVLDFGTSGNLRNSDLVMWDRQTESWWQQITGEAIVGELTGTRLTFIPAAVVSWAQFREAYPDGQLLSRDTGFRRNYGLPPYSGYAADGKSGGSGHRR